MSRLFNKSDGKLIPNKDQTKMFFEKIKGEQTSKNIKEFLFSGEDDVKVRVLEDILNPNNPNEETFLVEFSSGKYGIKTEKTKIQRLINEHLYKNTDESRENVRMAFKELSKGLTEVLFRNYLLREKLRGQ